MINVYVGFVVHARRFARKIEPTNPHPIIIHSAAEISRLEGFTGEITIHFCYDYNRIPGWPLIRDMLNRMKVWYADNVTIKYQN